MAKVWALVIGALLGGGVIFGMDYYKLKDSLAAARKEKAELQARIDYEKEKARLREVELNSTLERVRNDLRKKNNRLESERASAGVAVDSLLKHIDELNTRIKDASADAARVVAARNGELLGDCAKKYRDMAAEADRLRIKVEGLQTTVKACRLD